MGPAMKPVSGALQVLYASRNPAVLTNEHLQGILKFAQSVAS